MGQIFTQFKKCSSLMMLLLLLAGMKMHSQYTAIPDANFEQFLISMGYDDVSDGSVLNGNISGITTLHVPGNAGITDLTGIRSFGALQELWCFNGTLTSLDVSGMGNLNFLYCFANQITSLNVTGTMLYDLYCHDNLLTSLNLHGVNMGSIAVYSYNNPGLSCIETDDPAAAEANTIWLKDSATVYKISCDPYVYIPDANFELSLISLGYDDVVDGKALKDNIEPITSLDVSGQLIQDLTGLNNFIGLTTLNCSNNSITALNITLPSLMILNCSHNQLSTLDLSALTSLETLDCSHNGIADLIGSTNNVNLRNLNCSSNVIGDAILIQQFSGLTVLDCSFNPLTGLNVSSMIDLSILNCSFNEITTLQPNAALSQLHCNNNMLASLDLKGSNSISYLNATNNPLVCITVNEVEAAQQNPDFNEDMGVGYSQACIQVAIPDTNFEQALIDLGYDIVLDGLVLDSNISGINDLIVDNKNIADLTGIDAFSSLQYLNCSNNALTQFNFDVVHQLIGLNVRNNQLQSLDLTNVPNLNVMECQNNPMRCISVSDVDAANAQTFWIKDAMATYSTDCSAMTLIPDPVFEQSLIFMGYDSVLDGQIQTAVIATVEELSLFGFGLTDLTGIRDFASLKVLSVYFSLMTSLDVSGLSNLHTIMVSNSQLTTLNVSGTALETLHCENNYLTALDVAGLSTLKNLYCDNNQIQSLDLSGTQIYYVDCANNQLATLTFGATTSLQELYCSQNMLASLDVSGQYGLSLLHCEYNNLTSLNISNTSLTDLRCTNNSLSILNLSGLSTLTHLNTGYNVLTILDLTDQVNLVLMDCTDNQISSLDLSHNLNLDVMSCINNPMTCIQVSDVEAANGEQYWYKNYSAAYATDCTPYTFIPDADFEQALLSFGYDSIIDGKVPTAAIVDVTALELEGIGIADLTGIKDFANLATLNCKYNNLSVLDVSGLSHLSTLNASFNQLTSINPSGTALETLNCEGNQLTALDVTWLSTLTNLTCNYNQLQSLDLNGTSVSTLYCSENQLNTLLFDGMSSLTELYCSQNDLTSLDVSGQSQLTILDCEYNDLTSLNVSNTGLQTIYCKNNNLSSIDLSGVATLTGISCENNALTGLDLTDQVNLALMNCGNNYITSLDLSGKPMQQLGCYNNGMTSLNLSGITTMTVLSCSYNALTALDVSSMTTLEYLDCSNNQLTELSLSGLHPAEMHADENAMDCIQTDDPQAATDNPSWYKDPAAEYAVMCNTTLVPDASFEQALINLGYDSVLDGKVATSTISVITSLNISSKDIADLTGLEDFIALENLYCEFNTITAFGFPALVNLKSLQIGFNNLTQVDLETYPALESVSVRANQLTSLHLGNMPALQGLDCSFNALTTVDVSNCPVLIHLYSSQNPLTSLVMGSINTLQTLFCDSTLLPSVDLTHQPDLTYMLAVNNPNLICIAVDDIAVAESYPQWSKDAIASYSETGCIIYTDIPDANFEQALIDLGFDDIIDGRVITSTISGITTLDVSNLNISDLTGIHDFISLTSLDCSNNQISTLNINGITGLETLKASYNNIVSIDTYLLNFLTHLELQHNAFIQPYLPNSSLVYADLSYNNIGSWYGYNEAMDYLDLSHNNIFSAYIYMPSATMLNLSYNDMIGVDFDNISQLVALDFSNNPLTGVVLPAMPMLETLHCENNMLTKLNLRDKPSLTEMNATQNQLTCILVDNIEAAEAAPGWLKDNTATYALLCDAGPYTLIPDPAFEQALIDMNVDEIIDGQVATANISSMEELYIPHFGISDLTGISDFTSLQYLEADGNLLATLDLSGLSELESVQVSENMLTSLNLSGLENLNELQCYSNQLQTLDVSGCGYLQTLSCSYNALTSLSLSNNIDILDCTDNQLTSLDLNGMTQLFSLYCYSNNLQSLDISQVNLYNLDCTNNPLTCIKVANVGDADDHPDFYKDETAVYSTDCPGTDCEVTVWNGIQWNPSEPDGTKQAVFMADYEITTDLNVCSIEVGDGVNINVFSGATVTVHGAVTVAPSSTLVFENSANLLQSDGVVNVGNITVKRDAMVRRQDYVYWSSPVSGQNLHDFSSFTLINRFYVLDEAANNFAWANPAFNTFVPAVGYMVRAPNNYADYPAPEQLFTGIFTGTPHNGNIEIPVTHYGQGFNLIGNPYPSPVDADAFLEATPGTIYFWTHRLQSAESGANYASYNLMGGTAADTGGEAPNGYIQTGQGFILHTDDLATATFNNSMRVPNTDGQFYRTASAEKHRFWLNLSTPQSGINQILVGYAAGATQGVDAGIDGKQMENSNAISSRIDDLDYVIQGRALPFDANDVVPLKLKVAAAGNYQLAIDHTDGLFAAGQSIFLRDNLMGTVHDFAGGAYSFVTDAGSFAERFQIVYSNTTLGTNPVVDHDSLVIFSEGNTIHINSGAEAMNNVRIFDIRGRLIYEKTDIHATDVVLSDLVSEKQVLLVQVTTEEGVPVTKKYIY